MEVGGREVPQYIYHYRDRVIFGATAQEERSTSWRSSGSPGVRGWFRGSSGEPGLVPRVYPGAGPMAPGPIQELLDLGQDTIAGRWPGGLLGLRRRQGINGSLARSDHGGPGEGLRQSEQLPVELLRSPGQLGGPLHQLAGGLFQFVRCAFKLVRITPPDDQNRTVPPLNINSSTRRGDLYNQAAVKWERGKRRFCHHASQAAKCRHPDPASDPGRPEGEAEVLLLQTLEARFCRGAAASRRGGGSRFRPGDGRPVPGFSALTGRTASSGMPGRRRSPWVSSWRPSGRPSKSRASSWPETGADSLFHPEAGAGSPARTRSRRRAGPGNGRR